MEQTRKTRTIIGLIGASEPSEQGLEQARAVGREIARAGALLVCGGLGGVMAAAARGCAEAGGEVLGILPGPEPSEANPYVTIPVSTNLGHARNVVIAHTARVLIAVEGEYGTLSEIAIGLKLGRPVITLGGWTEIPGVLRAASPEAAVRRALSLVDKEA